MMGFACFGNLHIQPQLIIEVRYGLTCGFQILVDPAYRIIEPSWISRTFRLATFIRCVCTIYQMPYM